MKNKKMKMRIWALLFLMLLMASLLGTGGSGTLAASSGWRKDSTGWRYICTDQSLKKNAWLRWKKQWYYFNEQGYMQIGWKRINGKWYFFRQNGVMLTGWKKYQGKWYYLSGSGAMVTDTWIGQYYLNEKGAWTRTLEVTDYSIPDYYKTQLYNAANSVDLQGEEWTSFAVIADTHGDGQRTQTVIRYLLEHSDVERCFWLGDLGDKYFDEVGEKQYETFRESLLPCKDRIYVTIGNHDRWKPGWYSKEDVGIVYRDFLKGKKGLTGNPEDFYYYFDDLERRLRYLVINTSNIPEDQMAMSETELSWIRETGLSLPGEDWGVVILGHIDINTDLGYKYTSRNAEALSEMIAGCNGHVVGYFCGHEHLDGQSRVKDSFYQNCLVSDCIRKDQMKREANTREDGAVTVVSVNTTTGQVILQRVGLPMDGKLKNYNYLTD